MNVISVYYESSKLGDDFRFGISKETLLSPPQTPKTIKSQSMLIYYVLCL